MWTDYITSISHVLKVNEYGGRQAKVNEKRQCFKGWETLDNKFKVYSPIYSHPLCFLRENCYLCSINRRFFETLQNKELERNSLVSYSFTL